MSDSSAKKGFIHSHGRKLHEQGYNIVAIKPSEKRPEHDDWQNAKFTDESIDRYISSRSGNAGVGVLCNNVKGVDIDSSDIDIVNKVANFTIERLGYTPQRIGCPPRRLLPCRSDQTFSKIVSKTFVSPDGSSHKVEILGEGNQFVAYHIHPDTDRPYFYVEDYSELIEVPRDELPNITVADAKAICGYFESIVPKSWIVREGETASSDESRCFSNFDPLQARQSIKNGAAYHGPQIGYAMHLANKGYDIAYIEDELYDLFIRCPASHPAHKDHPRWKKRRDEISRSAQTAISKVQKEKEDARIEIQQLRMPDFKRLEFPVETLPMSLQRAIREVTRFVQCAPESALASVVSTLALSVGKQVKVIERNGLEHKLNTVFIVIADSGERKSACYRICVKPIIEIQKEEIKRWNEGKRKNKAQKEIIEKAIAKRSKEASNILADSVDTLQDSLTAATEIAKLESQIPNIGPEPQFYVDDITEEQFIMELAEHDEQLGMFSPDARNISRNIRGRYNDKKQSNEGSLLKLAEGEELMYHRRTDNTKVKLRDPKVNLLLFIQPDEGAALALDPQLMTSGLFARAFVLATKKMIGRRFIEQDDDDLIESELADYNELVRTLFTRYRLSQGAVYLKFTGKVRELWREWYNEVEERLGGKWASITDLFNKIVSHTVKMAALFQLIYEAESNPINHVLDREEDVVIEITEPAWWAAKACIDFFVQQMEAYYKSVKPLELYKNSRDLALWIVKKLNDKVHSRMFIEEGFTPRVIQQMWGASRNLTADACNAICLNLEMHGYLYTKKEWKAKRVDSWKYWVNPDMVNYVDFNELRLD